MEKSETGLINVLTIGIICCTVILSILSVLLNMYAYDLSKEDRIILSEENMDVEFLEGKRVNFKNLASNTTIEKKFTIKASENSTSILKYRIYMDVTSNNLSSTELSYSIKSSSNLTAEESGDLIKCDYTPFEGVGQTKIYEGTIKPGEIHDYSFVMYHYSASSIAKNKFTGDIIIELIETPSDGSGGASTEPNTGTSETGSSTGTSTGSGTTSN